MSLSNVIRYVYASDITSTIGSGKINLSYSNITAKYLTEGGTLTSLTTEDISTLGTYQAPTSSGHIRIKQLNGTVPTDGVYEVHFHNSQVDQNGKYLYLFLSGSGALFEKYEMPLYNIYEGTRLNGSGVLDVASGVWNEPRASHLNAGTYGKVNEWSSSEQFIGSGVHLSSQGIIDVGSGVWTANPSAYSGVNTFGRELQPIYYADIKQYYDFSNTRDEYAVEWYRGNTPLSSGNVTQARISVYNTSTGAAVFENASMSFAGYGIGGLRYNEASAVLTAGEPYQVIVSGTIDGATKNWQRIIGRNKLT